MIEAWMLILALADPSRAGLGEAWVLPNREICEAAGRHAIAAGHARSGKCFPATLDLEVWAAVAKRGEPM
jgi:hypothetical protein